MMTNPLHTLSLGGLMLYCLNVQAAVPPVHEFMLDNGLKLVVQEDPRAPVAVSQVWYKIGSSYEYDGITGVSHALEHMMFKGTQKHGPGEFSRIIAENGDRVAIGLDVRGRTLAARGWTRDGGDLYETLDRLDKEGCARYVVTDIAKDGTLQGPHLELLRKVCAATDRPVVASGGVSSLDDLRAIAELVPLGVEGSIVGKALYAKAFTLEEAQGVEPRGRRRRPRRTRPA